MATDNDFRWWVGRDGEHFEVDLPSGSTREDAIAEGRSQYGDDAFHIVEAKNGNPSLPEAEAINNLFIGMNEDLGGEDMYFGEDFSTTPEQDAELTEGFQKLYSAWLDKHKLWPHVYAFSATRNAEAIPETPSEGDLENGTPQD